MKRFKLVVILCCISLAKSSFASEISSSENVVNLTNIYRADSVLTIAFIDKDVKNKAKQTKFEAKLSDSVWYSTFPDREQIKIAKSRNVPDSVRATEYTVFWNGKVLMAKQQICFSQSTFMWYSTFFDTEHTYPLSLGDTTPIKRTLATLGSSIDPVGVTGSLLENLFINTAGFAIMLDDLHMWTFSIKTGQYCFALSDTALNNEPMDHPREFQSIKLRILAADSALSAWKYAVKEFEFIKRPASVPSKALFTHPIWPVSTFDEPKMNYLPTMNEFCAKNDKLNYPKAHLYLNSNWENVKRNFNITALSAEKKHPFVSILKNGHLISVELTAKITNIDDQLGDIVLENRLSGTLDISKPTAVNWLVDQLLQFNQTYGLDAFSLADGTVADFLTDEFNPTFKVYDEVVNKYPNFITTQYVQSVGSLKPSGLFFETAYKLQSAPAFVRLIGNGTELTALQQVIPRLLTLSLAGYQFIAAELVIPTPDAATGSANHEVCLQWIQAVLFIPALQIPFPPWKYSDDSFATTVGKLLKIRHQVLFSGNIGPTMFELAQKWVTEGEPIIRPMWFADAGDAQLAAINDQYMIGEHLIMAPITLESQTNRDVYLPKGRWCYMGNGTEYGEADVGFQIKLSVQQGDHKVIFFLRMNENRQCNVTFDQFNRFNAL